MKYYIIAGEASGDLHASNLIKELKKRDPEAQFRAWGGDMMRDAGAEIVRHINDLAFMGFVEVALNIKTILANIKFCKSDILNYQPDAVVFVDYPGFNLRIAQFCKKEGIRTIYYISPQVWAWHKSRVKKIKRDIDKMLVILPFEQEFYKKNDYEVEFVGHPLLDALKKGDVARLPEEFRQKNKLGDQEIVALLPGSRKQEISRMLAPMAATAVHFPEYQFVIAGTGAHSPDYYHSFMGNNPLPIVYGQTYDLLRNSVAAFVTSGTATLETALIGTPQVVCYKAGFLSYHIAKRLIDIKYISLVNLIMDAEVVKELIQHEFDVEQLITGLKNLTQNSEMRKNILKNYAILQHKLGGSGASENAAGIITDFLQH
jgi:lipid-A-disaccharide synthase